jgi:hypothetical protein
MQFHSPESDSPTGRCLRLGHRLLGGRCSATKPSGNDQYRRGLNAGGPRPGGVNSISVGSPLKRRSINASASSTSNSVCLTKASCESNSNQIPLPLAGSQPMQAGRLIRISESSWPLIPRMVAKRPSAKSANPIQIQFIFRLPTVSDSGGFCLNRRSAVTE